MAMRDSERLIPSIIFSAISIQVTHGSMILIKQMILIILIVIIVLVLSNKSFIWQFHLYCNNSYLL